MANLVALAAVFFLMGQLREKPETKVAPAPASESARPDAQPATVEERVIREVEPFHWSQVESSDYHTYVENLRRIGCPEETIRDIIKADVDKLYETRRRETVASAPTKRDFWKTGSPNALTKPDSRTQQKLASLNTEKKELLGNLLGPGALAAMNRPARRAQAGSGYSMDFLTEETQGELRNMERDFSNQLLKRMSTGATDAQDINEIRQIYADRDERVASLLTPAQKEEYNLRMSPTAVNMRLELDGFEPSETEFRDIFQARKAFDDEHSLVPGATLSAEAALVRTDAEQRMNGEIESVLGQDRFQEYLRNTDYDYKSISKIATRQGLPETSAARVFDMKTSAEEMARQVRMDTVLSPLERQQQLAAIQVETVNSLQGVLGSQGIGMLQQQGGGANWFNNLGRLNPRPVSKPKVQILTTGGLPPVNPPGD